MALCENAVAGGRERADPVLLLVAGWMGDAPRRSARAGAGAGKRQRKGEISGEEAFRLHKQLLSFCAYLVVAGVYPGAHAAIKAESRGLLDARQRGRHPILLPPHRTVSCTPPTPPFFSIFCRGLLDPRLLHYASACFSSSPS